MKKSKDKVKDFGFHIVRINIKFNNNNVPGKSEH